jgi:hypothetical protein
MFETPTLTMTNVSHAQHNGLCNVASNKVEGSYVNTTATISWDSTTIPDNITVGPYIGDYPNDGTAVPYPGITYPYTIEPFIPPQPYVPFDPYLPFVEPPHLFPQILPDQEILVVPKDKVEKRRMLRRELEQMEDPIPDVPKRPYRRIELIEE